MVTVHSQRFFGTGYRPVLFKEWISWSERSTIDSYSEFRLPPVEKPMEYQRQMLHHFDDSLAEDHSIAPITRGQSVEFFPYH